MGFSGIVFPKNVNDKKRIALRKFVADQIKHHRRMTDHFNKHEKNIELHARIDTIFYTLNWIEQRFPNFWEVSKQQK